MNSSYLLLLILVVVIAFVIYNHMQKNKSPFSNIYSRRPNISLAQNRILETSGF
jgi:hypothetical protein